jgi:hypothetical protein
MLLELAGLDELAIQQVRGSFYSSYKDIINGPSIADTIITAANISEVKVLLLNSFFTLEKDGVKWSASAFKILPPHKLPDDLDRTSAKAFFDDIKV